MEFIDFCKAIQEVINKQLKANPLAKAVKILNAELERLTKMGEFNKPLSMTQITILFEGFYRHVNSGVFKSELQIIRVKRWVGHYGVPTIPFLLSFQTQIQETTKLFNELSSENSLSDNFPWLIKTFVGAQVDCTNHVMIDPKNTNGVVVPATREVTGIFTKTHNPFGGFTTTPCDPVSQQFLAHAALSAKQGGRVLEIGAAFGAATLEALAKGATVFCNDISPENLAVVLQRYKQLINDTGELPTGDSNRLVLVPGELPNELLGLPHHAFDAILICRVFHFFSGKKIEESLALLTKLLTAKGKIYIVCETPFLKNWQRFLPEFTKRVERNEEWPGEICEPAKYESSGRATSLPQFVHWITKEILERSLKKAGLSIEYSEYINRNGQFPEDLLLPEYGKESVGAIGVKLG